MNNKLILGLIILVIGMALHFLLDGSDYTFVSGVVAGLGIGFILSNLGSLVKSSSKDK